MRAYGSFGPDPSDVSLVDTKRVDWSELTPSDWMALLVYGTLATSVALALRQVCSAAGSRRASRPWRSGASRCSPSWAGYAYRFELGTVAERVMAVLIPGTVVETGDKEVTVFRQADGQFVVNASIGVAHVSLVLDTGASSVVVRAEDAMKLKVPMKRLVYDVEVATANGRTLAAETELPSLAIGTLVQTHVKALVARPGALHENLLGMSYLNELSSFTILARQADPARTIGSCRPFEAKDPTTVIASAARTERCGIQLIRGHSPGLLRPHRASRRRAMQLKLQRCFEYSLR